MPPGCTAASDAQSTSVMPLGRAAARSPISATTRSLRSSVGPEPRRADRRQRRRQDQSARGRVAAGARARACARAAYPRSGARAGDGGWAVAARVHTRMGPVDIGTGLMAAAATPSAAGRIVRIDGETQSGSGALADYVEMVWVTPAMDGLFTGPGVRAPPLPRPPDPVLRSRLPHARSGSSSAPCSSATGCSPTACATPRASRASSCIMAETGVAIAAARAEAVAALAAVIAERRARDPDSPFPVGRAGARGRARSGSRDAARRSRSRTPTSQRCAQARERDRAAGRTLDGPHRSDLVVGARAQGACRRGSARRASRRRC